MKPLVVFDYDDVLIKNAQYYAKAVQEGAALLNAPEEAFRDFTRYAEAEEYHARGRHTILNYPHAFMRAVRYFNPQAPRTLLHSMKKIAQRPVWGLYGVELHDGALDCLRRLQDDFHVMLYTSGDRRAQRRKMANTPHIFTEPLVQHTRVVTHKDRQSFIDAVHDCYPGIGMDRVVMIGDSVRRDILPADEAGARTVYFESGNWPEMNYGVLPPRTRTITALSALPELLYQMFGEHPDK